MSRIDELLKEYCPNGVEYKPVSSVSKRIKGSPVTAGQMKDMAVLGGNIRIFAGGQTQIDTDAAHTAGFNIINTPSVLVKSRGIIDVVYYDKPFTFKQEMWAYQGIDSVIDTKFLHYVLSARVKELRDKSSGMGSMPQIKTADTDNLEIPVPPLPVQQEIVRILDSFTSLQDELQKELEERKKQYTWLEEELITGPRYTVKKLSECATVERGKRLVRKQLSSDKNGGYPVYQNALEPLGYYSESNRRSNIPFVIAAGAAGKLGYSYTEFWAADDCYTIVNNRNVYGRYLYYAIEIQSKYLKDHVRMGSIPRIAKSFVEETQIFLPDYQQQVIIANKLDTLFQLIDKTIPSEIALRQQQYSYYRDKLLSFPRKEA